MPSYRRVPEKDDLYFDPKRKRYHLRVYTPALGERFYSLKTKSLKEAIRRMPERRAAVLKLDPLRVPTLYAEIAEECFKVRHKRNRDSTVTEASYIFEKLTKAFGHLPIEAVTDSLWLEQVDEWKRTTGRKVYSHFRVYAKQIDRYAFNKGYKKFRCDFPVDDPKKREGRLISETELATLVDACVTHYVDGKPAREKRGKHLEHGRRTALFIKMARYMGMRRGEILNLPLAQIDTAKRQIELFAEDTKTGSKTKRGRKFAIAPECLPNLIQATHGPGFFLFANPKGTAPVYTKSVNRTIKRLCAATGIHFKPHDLRHTFLTQKLLVERKDPMSVAIYAGVSLSVIQDVYLHPTVDDTRHVVEAA